MSPSAIEALHALIPEQQQRQHEAPVSSATSGEESGHVLQGWVIADLVVDFTEPLLAVVLLSAENCSGKKLLLLFQSIVKNNPDVKEPCRKVADSAEIDKMDTYMLRDLVRK